MMQRDHSPIPYVLTALLVVACEADGGSRCSETRRVVAFTEVTSDGSSAEQLMRTMAGAFAGDLTWHGGADVVQVTPGSGSTTLEISLTHDGGEVALIERDAHDVPPGERLACVDELVIPAVLTLETADGGLRGRWDVDAMYAVGSGVVTVEQRPFGAGNDGTFAASLKRPEAWAPGSTYIFLQNGFDPSGVAGSLVLTATRELRDDGKIEEGVDLVARLATWSIQRP